MIAAIPSSKGAARQTGPHLSASQLRSYSECSLRWYLSRRYKPAFVSSSLVFRSAFHTALQAFYEAHLQGSHLALDGLLAAYDAVWAEEETEIQYGKENQAGLRTLGERMFTAFLEQARPGTVIGVEEPFSCPLADGLPPLIGYIDLVEVRQDEPGKQRLHLVDFKTAARKPSSPEDLDPDQLVLYAIAAHRTGLLSQFDMPFCLEYRVVTKAKTPEVIPVEVEPDHHDGVRLIEKAKVIHKGMAEGICFPTSGWQCSGCGYQKLCKEWPELPKEKEKPPCVNAKPMPTASS